MDEKGFREFLVKRKLNEKTIQAHIRSVQDFGNFLRENSKGKDMGKTTRKDLERFVRLLVKQGKNTEENVLGLARYGLFSGNKVIQVALLEDVLGSHYVLKNLWNSLGTIAGEEKCKEVFQGIKLPALGTRPEDRPEITKKVMERLETKLDQDTWKKALSSNLEAVPRDEYIRDRERFLESKNIDEFLKNRHKEYIDLLDKHRRENTLYYTQEIDDEVLEYVRNTPTCQNGVREGDIIYVTKIPYMAKKYLGEKDPNMKRYYACHCPWVRESIRTGNVKVSPNFCYCSAGYEKLPWDIIFDQPVKADVIDSVLKGGLVCKFAIHIPKEFLKSSSTARKN